VLGASRQLGVIGDALIDLAGAHPGDPVGLATGVGDLVDHVTRTRGASSQAVVNGVERMARPVLDRAGSLEGEAADLLVESVRGFRQDLRGWISSVRDKGADLLRRHRSVLVYDYSSTVAQVLAGMTRPDLRLTVYVPEARSLDGGRKYLADWAGLEVNLHLIPDAALGWAMSRCDAAVVGAETLSAEGGCYNTIGTALVANEASRAGVPFYVLSVLLKTDLGDPGGARPSPTLDFLRQLEAPVPAPAPLAVDGLFPDLDYTGPAEITRVVTEVGVVSPDQVGPLAAGVLTVPEPVDG